MGAAQGLLERAHGAQFRANRPEPSRCRSTTGGAWYRSPPLRPLSLDPHRAHPSRRPRPVRRELAGPAALLQVPGLAVPPLPPRQRGLPEINDREVGHQRGHQGRSGPAGGRIRRHTWDRSSTRCWARACGTTSSGATCSGPASTAPGNGRGSTSTSASSTTTSSSTSAGRHCCRTSRTWPLTAQGARRSRRSSAAARGGSSSSGSGRRCSKSWRRRRARGWTGRSGGTSYRCRSASSLLRASETGFGRRTSSTPVCRQGAARPQQWSRGTAPPTAVGTTSTTRPWERWRRPSAATSPRAQPTRDRADLVDTRPPLGQPGFAHPGGAPAGHDPRRAGRRLAAVRDPRLVQPRSAGPRALSAPDS